MFKTASQVELYFSQVILEPYSPKGQEHLIISELYQSTGRRFMVSTQAFKDICYELLKTQIKTIDRKYSQFTQFIPTLDTATKIVIMIFDLHETFNQEVRVNQKLCKNIVFNTPKNICFGYLLESHISEEAN